ncbi:MAG TPA: hypothetical protein VGO09_00735 [Flavisolibacter sp.]|jgi:hypothetical protein|nr:hypothetical protein [Flavisolibacter sp.]
MKQLFLAVLISLGISGFSQESTYKVKTKTKIESPGYDKKTVRDEGSSTAYARANSSAHTAYRSTHARPVHRHNVRIHRVHHHVYSASRSKHHHVSKHQGHYKEVKKKYHNGKYKVKYKS